MLVLVVVAVLVVVVVCSAPTFYVLVSPTREKLPPDHIKEVAFALLQVLQEVNNTIHTAHTYIHTYMYTVMLLYIIVYILILYCQLLRIHTCVKNNRCSASHMTPYQKGTHTFLCFTGTVRT